MERITNTFIGREFGWDTFADVDWEILLGTVRGARRVLASPEKFPNANFEHCEEVEHEGSLFLLRGPVEYLVHVIG